MAVALCATGTLAAPQRPGAGGSEKDAVITSQQLEVNFDGNYVNKLVYFHILILLLTLSRSGVIR